MTVRCDISGRDQGGFVAEAQRALRPRRSPCPTGYRVEWLGMFENLARARKHFMVLIPITIGLIFVLLWVTFGSPRAAIVVLLAVPFACIGGVLALYVRGMHLNMSSAVGFTALFGVAIMDGVLMVRWISTLRVQGMALEEAIVQGALERLRPILMTSIVAIFGLLAGVAGHGPGFRRAAAAGHGHRLGTLQLHDADALRRARLLSHPRPGAAQVGRLGRRFRGRGPLARRALARRLHRRHRGPAGASPRPRRQAGRLPYLRRDEPRVRPRDRRRQGGRDAGLHRNAGAHGGPHGQGQGALSTRGPEQRKALWREQLLTLRLFHDVHELIQRSPDHVIDRDFVLETIVTRMPYENYEKVFSTFIRWSRFGDLFAYDETVQVISLGPQATAE